MFCDWKTTGGSRRTWFGDHSEVGVSLTTDSHVRTLRFFRSTSPRRADRYSSDLPGHRPLCREMASQSNVFHRIGSASFWTNSRIHYGAVQSQQSERHFGHQDVSRCSDRDWQRTARLSPTKTPDFDRFDLNRRGRSLHDGH